MKSRTRSDATVLEAGRQFWPKTAFDCKYQFTFDEYEHIESKARVGRCS